MDSARRERIREAFSSYLHDLSNQRAGPNVETLDQVGFESFAEKIPDDAIKRRFCELAFDMLEANILEHLEYAPRIKDIRNADSVRALREWRQTLVSWEKALNAMRRMSGA